MQKPAQHKWDDLVTVFGWILAITVPMVIYLLLPRAGFIWSERYFLTFFSATLILWMFRLVPYLVPAILLVGACLLLNLVPSNVILSGFSSNSFILILSLGFLSALIIKSDMLIRPTLWLLAKMPDKFYILECYLILVGVLSTPFINAQVNRLDVQTTLYKLILTEAKLKHNHLAQQYLCMAFYGSTIFLSELFLTGKTGNLPVLEMLPLQTQMSFTWTHWLLAASVPVFIMLAAICIPFLLFFKKTVPITLNRQDIAVRLHSLGKFNFAELVAWLAVLLLIVGIVLSSLHILSLTGFCMTLLFFVLLFPILSKQDFRSYNNWAFLFYVGAIIGIVQSMHFLQLDSAVFRAMPWLASLLTTNIVYLICGIFIICMISTILVGTVPSIILLTPILLPLAKTMMISPWVIAFTVLVASEAWFIAYQSSYQLYFTEITEHDQHYANSSIVLMNIYFIPCRLIALLLSIYFWRYMGLV